MGGLELMVIGMTMVMLFLLLMVAAIQVLSLLEPKPETKTVAGKTNHTAVLAAAVSAYQADTHKTS